MSPETEALATLRGDLIEICTGTTFVVIGLMALAVAALRRRSGVRAIVWVGVWSAMYGVLSLVGIPLFVSSLPGWLRIAAPYVRAAVTYLMLAIATMAWLQISRGRFRLLLRAIIFAALAIGVAGFGCFVFTGVPDKMIPWNNLLAAGDLMLLLIIIAVPTLSRKYLVLPQRGVLAVGSLLFALEALFVNLSRPFGFESGRIWDSLAFAVLLLSFGYVALQTVFANERRLLSIESELEIARELQLSILPDSIPQITDLRVAAAYLPMTAVAGDFYEFLPVDQHRAGFLVADVSGHGVPAALIASMIKVAVQSVAAWASDPGELLRRLGGILSGQLRGQFVSAAYLWIDTETHQARYSAAGHPPLLCWRAADSELQRVESNGLLFGVMPDADYPVCDLAFASGDRFLLYTDGVTEPENAGGDSFGDQRLEQVLRGNQSYTAGELSEHLLAEVRNWQPVSMSQQDDITLIVIDVL
ncbi:MAG TPA: PP2C family protein-serine/threonine phosphatase [Terriglobales bacterium]